MHSTVRTTTQGTSVDRSRKLLRKMNHHESMLLAGTWVLMRYPTPVYLWEEKKKNSHCFCLKQDPYTSQTWKKISMNFNKPKSKCKKKQINKTLQHSQNYHALIIKMQGHWCYYQYCTLLRHITSVSCFEALASMNNTQAVPSKALHPEWGEEKEKKIKIHKTVNLH